MPLKMDGEQNMRKAYAIRLYNSDPTHVINLKACFPNKSDYPGGFPKVTIP